MPLARLPLALGALALLLTVAAIAGLRHLPPASAAGSTRCGALQVGTAAADTLDGTAGRDLLKGKGGDDLIRGAKSGDCLRGGRGDDTIRGGAGHDFLRGGGGRDRLVARDGDRDWVRCGPGKDLALVGANDKVRGCERVRRHASGGGHAGGAGYPSLRSGWNGGFDSGCKLAGSAPGAWDVNETNADHRGGSTRIERNVVGERRCAAKFTDSASNSMVRSELGRSATGARPRFTYEMLVRVPSGQTFPKGSTLTQTKQEKSGGRGCYNGGWGISDGTGRSGGALDYRTVSRCTSPQINGWRIFHAGALPRDRWFALKLRERFSNDPRVGFVQGWIDADGSGPDGYVEVLPKTHVDNLTGRTVRLRIGSYRQATDHRTTIYMDGFHLECEAHC